MTTAHIKCDLCGWKKKVDFKEIPSWHNVPCPECEDEIEVIIDDADMKIWKVLNVVVTINNFLLRLFPKAKTKRIHIDSARLK